METLHCPRCNSTDLYYETGFYQGSIYHCKRCDYVGPLVIIWDDEEEGSSFKPNPEEGVRIRFPSIPLWIKILAIIFLVIFVIIGLK